MSWKKPIRTTQQNFGGLLPTQVPSLKKIPWKVLAENGDVLYEYDEVLNCWKHDFEGLLRAPAPETNEQQDFIEGIKLESNQWQREWTDENTDGVLNREFSKSEVAFTIDRAKKGKAPGIDGIVSDTLHNRTYCISDSSIQYVL